MYAGGLFTSAGGTTVNYTALWNGHSWSPLGIGMDNPVTTLAVMGKNLVAGGYFSHAGGVAANYIALWNGNSWSRLGSGLNNGVNALAVSGSSNLVNWVPLQTNVMGGPLEHFSDVSTPNYERRFYRTMLRPPQ